MKSGIIRRIDDLGRVVIPKDVRKVLGAKEGDSVEIYFDGSRVCVEKYVVATEYRAHILSLVSRMRDEGNAINKMAIQLLKEAADILGEQIERNRKE